MKQKQLYEMTTREMVEEYNALTGKSIKKFSSRSAGFTQLANARLAATTSVDLPQHTCPRCGSTGDDHTALGEEGTYLGDAVLVCHACDTEFLAADGTEYIPEQKYAPESTKRAESTKRSWQDASVATKRSARHAVRVTGRGTFSSVLQAFKALGLPQQKHIKFRGALKQSGTLTFEFAGQRFEFTAIEV